MATNPPFDPAKYRQTQLLGADGYEAIQMMKDQLIIVLIERLGGKVDVSVRDIDTIPVGKILNLQLSVDQKMFHFEVRAKH